MGERCCGNSIPDDDQLEKAGSVLVFDETGSEIPFSSLVEQRKTIVVFISMFHNF